MVRPARSRRRPLRSGRYEPELTVLFVPGWQADRTVWGGVIAALGPSVKSVDVDLRGSGELRDVPGPYSIEQLAADLRELIEGLDEGAVILVGHSMGATIAMRLAIDAPQLVAGLVLIAPVPASGAEFSAKGAEFLRSTVDNRDAARKWLAKTFANPPEAAELERLCDAAARTSTQAALEGFESWTNADFAEATKQIQARAVVVAPEHDNPQMYREKVAALLPNARFVVLPESGHYAIVEKPAAVAEIINELCKTLAN